MKTHTVLFEHRGENSDTAHDPVALWTGQVDLEREEYRCLNWDDNRQVQVKVYQVHDVHLPDFLTVEEWVRDPIRWKYAWGFGADPEWPECWQRWIASAKLDEWQKVAVIRLLRTDPARMRSNLRLSLRDQLIAWLEADPDERQHLSPLSRKQWDAVYNLHLAVEAKNISTGLYRNRSLNTGVPVKVQE